MDIIEELKALGVNTDEALSRFMKNTALYVRMLGKFPAAVRDADVKSCFEAGDNEKAVAAAHTLKGVTGNLSLTPLYKAYTDVVALLRANEPEKAKEVFEQILPTEEKIIACIEKNA